MNNTNLQCATDGGCSPNPGEGGYAFVIENVTEFYGYVEYGTNNEMELRAFIKLVKYLNSYHPTQKADIFVDSSYVVNGVSKWMHTWVKRNWEKPDGTDMPNWELWAELYEIYNPETQIIHKVLGHTGHPLNERADELCHVARNKKKDSMTDKVVSVVLTHINSEGVLKLNPELLDEVVQQNHLIDFILVVNNRWNYPIDDLPVNAFTTIMNDSNISVSATRNNILSMVSDLYEKYTHVAFIDGDDNIESNYAIDLCYIANRTDKYTCFNGTWISTNGMHYDLFGEKNKNIQNAIKYVNWLYLYNINWINSVNLRYPNFSTDNWAEDEFLFSKIKLIDPDPIPVINKHLYIYNRSESEVSKLDDHDSDLITEYLNYGKTFELRPISGIK